MPDRDRRRGRAIAILDICGMNYSGFLGRLWFEGRCAVSAVIFGFARSPPFSRRVGAPVGWRRGVRFGDVSVRCRKGCVMRRFRLRRRIIVFARCGLVLEGMVRIHCALDAADADAHPCGDDAVLHLAALAVEVLVQTTGVIFPGGERGDDEARIGLAVGPCLLGDDPAFAASTVARGPHEVGEAPRRSLSASAFARASATCAAGRAFRAGPNRESTRFASRHAISSSRANPESASNTTRVSGHRARNRTTTRAASPTAPAAPSMCAGRSRDAGRRRPHKT